MPLNPALPPPRTILRCHVCGHRWAKNRTLDTLPKQCANPACKSRRWQDGRAQHTGPVQRLDPRPKAERTR